MAATSARLALCLGLSVRTSAEEEQTIPCPTAQDMDSRAQLSTVPGPDIPKGRPPPRVSGPDSCG